MRIRLLAAFAATIWMQPAAAFLPPQDVLELEQASLGNQAEDSFLDVHDEPMDEVIWFRGYPPEFWNEFPTASEIVCQDEQCFDDIVGKILDAVVLHELVIRAAANWQFLHGEYTLRLGLPDDSIFENNFVPLGEVNMFHLEIPALASAGG